jgi:glycosyltransferase involved in cell wall biosynthesis
MDMKELVGKDVLLVVENNDVPFDKRVWREALTLRDAGARVSIVCPRTTSTTHAREVLDDVQIHRYNLTVSNGSVAGYWREYLTAFVKTTYLLHRLLFSSNKPDVVHVANPPDIFWPLGIYLRLFGVRFIFDEHDLGPEAYLSRFEKEKANAGLLYRALRLFQILSYKVAHVIISTNESYRASALAANPTYASKTFIVRNGPDTRWFSRRPQKPELRKGRRFLAAYIGIMAIQDGVEYIIRAVDVLVKERRFCDFIVYLIGSGDDWARLRDLTNKLHLNEYIVFTGRIPDEPALEILSTTDVCLSPDPFNPLNNISTMNKIMEYMALGKPIVSFDLKEARYSAQESALYVENNNVAAFADGMLKLFQDRDLRVHMGQCGEERISKILCWQTQSHNLLSAYRFLLDF